MSVVRYTLLADGPSDRCLMRIINWVLDDTPLVQACGLVEQFADLRRLRDPPRGLARRIRAAVELFPCDVLFVHRDAEREPLETRVAEIDTAAGDAGVRPCVPVVPVRMTEAWLLIDERAIRRAAGNPNGSVVLDMPQEPERLPDPKRVLIDLLVTASQSTGRRRAQFKSRLGERAQRVADFTRDLVQLRRLSAFNAFERETRHVMETLEQSR